jgi:hypothetical protein
LSNTRKLTAVFEADPALAGLLKQTAALRRLDQDFRRLVPAGLAAASRVQSADTSELVVSADHGAAAAKLKLLAPELLGKLRDRGWHFTAIRVKVQVRTHVGEVRKPVQKQIDSLGRWHLEGLAATLPEGPLRDAVNRLAKS